MREASGPTRRSYLVVISHVNPQRLFCILALFLIAPFAPGSAAASAPSVSCQYVLGFLTLHDDLPTIVGTCVDNQAFAANGDSIQHTSGGMLVWRKADNWTAFTDGNRTWLNGPVGLQERLNTERFPWEGAANTVVQPVENVPAFQMLVPSWNATTPPGTWVGILARALEASGWTKWYGMGDWASDTGTIQRHSVPGQSDANGHVDTDTLHLATPATGYQLEAILHGTTTAIPTISTLTATTFGGAEGSGDRSVWGTNLPVPARSQMLPAYQGLGFGGGGEVWCSATSTSMLMAYWGNALGQSNLQQSVPAVAAGVYDYNYQGTGNWPFNIAYAANFGLQGSVMHFSNFASVEPWIAAKVPLAISVAFGPGELAGSPISSSPGHLIVVRGFTSTGDVIVNDPAVQADGMALTYQRAQLERAWQQGSTGIAYVVYPSHWHTPT